MVARPNENTSPRPPSSKRLSDLEAAVDTALLYRHSRGVTLTPAGESLLHHARNVLYGLERMQGELSEYADGVRGHVRVHATISAIVQFLPEDLGAFSKEHPPNQDRSAGTPDPPTCCRRWHEGTADIGICNMGQANTNGLQTRPTAPTAWCWWCPKTTPWPSARPISF